MSLGSASKGAGVVVAVTMLSLLGIASVLFDHARSDSAEDITHVVTIVRVPPAEGNGHVALAPAAEELFQRPGKQNRADIEDLQSATATTPDKPQHFLAASMTAVDMDPVSAVVPETTALGHEVNRGVKSDRLSLPQMAVAKLLPPAEEPAESAAGTSAALFFVSPSPTAHEAPETAAVAAAAEGPSVAALAARSPETTAQASWADLVRLARVKGGDGEDKEPSIFGGLTEKEFRAREFRCMATAIYFEARGETTKGQIAVGQVIMTRVRSDFYPNTICGVVYQGQWNRNACQFSFACDGIADTPKEKKHWEAALQVAKNVISGKAYLDEVGAATHYHATYVSPDWRKLVKRVTKIGVHIFYKAPFAKPLVASSDLNEL